jgi:hypothetical protein
MDQLAIFAMQYLLELWELDGVSYPDCTTRFMEHLGAFFCPGLRLEEVVAIIASCLSGLV